MTEYEARGAWGRREPRGAGREVQAWLGRPV
jgi:hypothetical protein